MIQSRTHRTKLMTVTQKRLVRVTLDIECYDDLDIRTIDWKDLLELEGDEEVHTSIKEVDWF